MFYLEVEEKKQSLLYIPPLKLTPKGSWKSMVGRWHLFLFGARPIFRDCISSGSVLPTENPPIFPGRHFRKFFSLRLRPQKLHQNPPGTLPKWRIYGATFVLGVPLIGSFGMGCENVSTMAAGKRKEKQTLARWKCGRWFFFGSFHSWLLVEFSFFLGGFLRSTQPKFNKSYATHEKR